MNLGVRFLLEVTALAVLTWWGIAAGSTWWQGAVLGGGAAGLAATGWGLFVSPRARFRGAGWLPLLVEIAVFGCAVAALMSMGHVVTAVAFAGIAAGSRSLKAVTEARSQRGVAAR